MLQRDTHGPCMEDLDELFGMFLHMLSYRRSTLYINSMLQSTV